MKNGFSVNNSAHFTTERFLNYFFKHELTVIQTDRFQTDKLTVRFQILSYTARRYCWWKKVIPLAPYR